MEVAEVRAAFPEMECVWSFPRANIGAIWDLLRRLREMFAKSLVTKEDSIRLGSIREAKSRGGLLAQQVRARRSDFSESCRS